nr:DUF2878 domain-containing protein [Polynucleobacter sp. IMCC 29146]
MVFISVKLHSLFISAKRKQFTVRQKIANFVLFQVGWFACIFGGAFGYVMGAVIFSLALVAVSVWQAPFKKAEISLFLKIGLYGLVGDTLLQHLGLLHFKSPVPWPFLSPIWMWTLWVLFATTLNQSMAWLQGKPLIAALLGSIFGPLSYIAGVEMGAATWGNQTQAIVLIGLIWAIGMPVFLFWAKQVPKIAPLTEKNSPK